MEPPKIKTQKRTSTMTINGRVYDTEGRIVDSRAKLPLPKSRQYGSFDIKPSGAIHTGPARSNTLRRTGLAKPLSARPLASRHVRTIVPIVKHPLVSHFERPASAHVDGPHVVQPSVVLSALNNSKNYEQPIGLATQVQNYSPSTMVAKPVKKRAPSLSHKITDHLHHSPQHTATKTGIFKRNEADKAYSRITRTWNHLRKRIRPTPPVIISTILGVVLILMIVCYLTIPALSLFVAAKSAGVDASYPGYIPTSYHFKGPVTYSEGKVLMKFAASGGDASFNIEQNDTYWDSGAVLDNYVLARTQDYLTYSQGGITIYTFGSQAAWVNAGVLHTIDGNAQLTSDQILRIAGSM